MSTITTINASDLITNSRTVLNTNMAALNTDKIETSTLDTDTSLAANSDLKIATQKAVKAYIDALGGLTNLVPSGSILPYGGSAAPTNYLLCDGTAVSRATYVTLFTLIGTTYGVGNGSTTFNLPDGRGRHFIGAGVGTLLATFSSRASNVLTVTGLSNVANNEFQTGQAVTYHTSGSVITGLANDTVYYIVRVTNTTFSLATSLANAQNGTLITLTSDGTGTQTFTLTLTTRTRGDYGGEENHAMSATELLSHGHTFVAQAFSNNGGVSSPDLYDWNNGGTIATSATGGNAGMNVMSPFFVGNWIIKT